MTPPHEHGTARCRELMERLSEYLDGELDPEACRGMDEHMEDCAPCRAFLESLRRTVALIERQPRPRLPDDLRREVTEAFARLHRGASR